MTSEARAGGRAIDPELAGEAWDEPDLLTDRERQVLRMAALQIISVLRGPTVRSAIVAANA